VSRPFLIAILGLVIVTLAIGLNFLTGPAPDLSGDAHQPASTESLTAEQDAATSPAETPRILKPTFDVVRVNPDGDAVFAGRAEPGSTVVIRDGDTFIGQATPDERGEWVYVPESPLEPGSRRLNLEMHAADQEPVSSGSDVVLVVPEHGRDVAGRPATGASGILALNVPRAGGGPSTVLQTPANAEQAGPLSIEVVDYRDATQNKQVSISGRAAPGSSVRLYLDDDLLGDAVADVNGRWFLSPRRISDPGERKLRADQLANDGKVVARVEVPFEPMALMTSTGAQGAISIEPGNNLWRIAVDRYGTGYAYSVIYEANRDQIKDPDLIYPGQVLTLPAATN